MSHSLFVGLHETRPVRTKPSVNSLTVTSGNFLAAAPMGAAAPAYAHGLHVAFSTIRISRIDREEAKAARFGSTQKISNSD